MFGRALLRRAENRNRSDATSTARPRPGVLLVHPTAPAVRLPVNSSFAALSVNLKLVNGSAADLFPV